MTSYNIFLDKLEIKIQEKEFRDSLKKVIEIDSNYYSKQIEENELLKIITEYREKEIINPSKKKVQVLLLGNPELVFRLGIEAVRNNSYMLIGIDDFCLAQNKFIVEAINSTIKECNLKIEIDLKNVLTVNEIINNNLSLNKTICIGDSNKYNLLLNKIDNLQFYPYNIFEVYSDSDEFDDLRKKIYNYAISNGYEIEMYDMELKIDDVIEIMNADGYGFCSVLLSKDNEKQEKFKQEIYSQYVIVNENPFKKTEFKLEI